jgi:hypothetical protein
MQCTVMESGGRSVQSSWSEVVSTVTVASIDGVAGMAKYRLALSLPSTATNVHSLFGDEANPMVFPTDYQDVSAAGAAV